MPRRLLAPLACASLLFVGSAAKARGPIPASTTVTEEAHTIEVTISRAGATLEVTRSLFNPTLVPAKIDLPIPLPCEALLDQVRIEERGPGGAFQWKAAKLLDPDQANAQFDEYYLGSSSNGNGEVAFDSDTALLVSRSDWHCYASLEIWPIPPVQQRRVAYRAFIPSSYDQGRYTIELPQLDSHGMTPQIELSALLDDELRATLGSNELQPGTVLDGARHHAIVLSPRDPGRGRVRAIDLDVEAMIANTPATAARITAVGQNPTRLLHAEFDAPAQLVELPRVRRAVLVLDGSRSLGDYQRERLQELGGAYFEALAAMDARVEVLVFDREVHRMYHDFVPAAWAAEDLPKLQIAPRNGSEVGQALTDARTLLAEPSEVEGADWILVLSDLDLRSDFDVAAELAAAERSSVRMHVVRPSSGAHLLPELDDHPWTAVARAAGGMAWRANEGWVFADELVSPKRIWNLRFDLLLADGTHLGGALDDFLEAGRRRVWSAPQLGEQAMAQIAFVGEVWGQRRAWTASPDPIEGRRLAGALATDARENLLSDLVRTALAFHANVVSPFSSAWALAQFDGAAATPKFGTGFASSGGGSYGFSTRCGGVVSHPRVSISHATGFDLLIQPVLDRCQVGGEGRLSFETTDLEIVAVDSANHCVTEQTWEIDIAPSQSSGHQRVTVAYAGGVVSSVEIAPL